MQFDGQSMSTVCYRNLTWTEYLVLSIFKNKIPNYAFDVVAPDKLPNVQFSFISLTLWIYANSVALQVYLLLCTDLSDACWIHCLYSRRNLCSPPSELRWL